MIKLRYYQEEAALVTFAALQNDDCKPLIAIPTGAGKSFIIARLIQLLVEQNASIRILVLSHIQEIIKQDHEAIRVLLGFDAGIYSASLGMKDIKRVTIASIQTAYRSTEKFIDVDVVIIDEAHMVALSDKTMYKKLLNSVQAKVCGLTATPFRTGSGYIYKGKNSPFTDLVYDLTTFKSYMRLVAEGFISKIITRETDTSMDTDGIRTTAGDFNNSALADRFDRDEVTKSIISEVVKYGKNYKQWLLFSIDIAHAEHIASQLTSNGIKTICIHSKMLLDRDKAIADIKAGAYRAVVNVDILTTGFDVPSIDLIAMLRPTKSEIIHVQTVGRGGRVSEGKDHCLFLDFGGNTARLGAINDLDISNKERKKGSGEAITKTCPICKVIQHPAVRVCDICDHKFVFQHKLTANSSNLNITGKTKKRGGQKKLPLPDDGWYFVDNVSYEKSRRYGRPETIQVTYLCGAITIRESICLYHKTNAKYFAQSWIKFRLGFVPDSIDIILRNKHLLRTPRKIKVKSSAGYANIVDSIF